MTKAQRSEHGWTSARRNAARVFREHFLTILLWPLIALLIGLISWQWTLTSIREQRAAARDDALREAAIVARAYAEHLTRTLEAIDQIALHLKFSWETTGGALKLEGVSRAGLLPKQGFFAAIVDDSGRLITSTTPPADATNVAKEDFFFGHAVALEDALFIGTPRVGVFTRRMVVPFSRRLINRDGEFDGVVLVSVVPEYFTAEYDEKTLGEHGMLAVLDADRELRLARIGSSVQSDGHRPLLDARAIRGAHGTLLLPGATNFSDGRSRFIAWQTTEMYDMVALVGLDEADVLAALAPQERALVFRAILVTILTAVLAAAASFVSWRLAWRKDQLELARRTYRSATERGNDGFYIASVIEDRDGSVVDFEIVDCNERGAELLHRRRDKLIGLRTSQIYGPRASARLHAILLEAMEKHKFEDELNLSDEQAGQAWVHLSVRRSDGQLAITLRDITHSKMHVAQLEKLSNEDPLTGLPNRLWLNNYLPAALARASQAGGELSLLFIDLDGFKRVNDTAGHDAGDELLRHAAHRMKECVRPQDSVARIGGDEFVVTIEGAQREDAANVARRIIQAFAESFRLPAGVHRIGTSIGISTFPDDAQDADTLLKHADIAMYSVKLDGKHAWRFFDRRRADFIAHQHRKEAELREALESDQIVVFYQPRIDARSGRPCGFEALARWAHPTRGILEPSEFIDLAEETGLINRLGDVVAEKVCRQLAFWRENGQEVLPVSINVSARQFMQPDLLQQLGRCLERCGVEPGQIEIEVTESSMMHDAAAVAETLSSIRGLGMTLSLDDFGTGYSSLSQLQDLDFDVLKVDRAFTARLQEPKGEVFFSAIISMAHSLGMRVVAEGVETREQMELLKALGCDELQGFGLSKPVAAERVSAFLM
ncbi:bifunctional diguanylate cyclase/phosphodiesterase [Noviherbaspirillum aridicola]|uniref:Diguanylate cyclase (GGDEF)-like protein n=1 Tax=Noviherbaspirillum aridicola TaxID=2849687 RepID=A0ABQ4PYZ0_9BURK|nr:EAL domain-containing protein [Noviherbaspirillum aridicola]GIZ50068.1 hypothetical protein NCCP691_00820 [Noviherbaspirillum aridicola]